MEFPFLFSFRARDVRNPKFTSSSTWKKSTETPLVNSLSSKPPKSQELGACPPLGYWDPFGMMAFQDDDVRKYMGKTDWCRSYYEEGKAMHSGIELFLFVRIVVESYQVCLKFSRGSTSSGIIKGVGCNFS